MIARQCLDMGVQQGVWRQKPQRDVTFGSLGTLHPFVFAGTGVVIYDRHSAAPFERGAGERVSSWKLFS